MNKIADIVEIPLTPVEALVGLLCEETHTSGATFMGEPVRCGEQATSIVWHQRSTEGAYAMCDACTDHNVRNRNGRLLLATSEATRMRLTRTGRERAGGAP